MALAADITTLRLKIGESIPAGGTESDTLFTDGQINVWLDGNDTMDGAALEGWEAKLAALANLVSVTDGAASRELSDAFDHAAEMVSYYSKKLNGRSGRARVGKIIRS